MQFEVKRSYFMLKHTHIGIMKIYVNWRFEPYWHVTMVWICEKWGPLVKVGMCCRGVEIKHKSGQEQGM